MKKSLFFLFPFGVFLVLAGVSWNRWIEPYVDSGRELETPWRLAQGQRLYRDVRFYHGPLAPYLAAGTDALFGRSLAARIALAAAIALAHLEALRRLARRVLSPARASLVCGVIVATTFFLRPGGQLFPFSFDTSLAVAAIAWALALAAGRPNGSHDRTAGLCLLVALLCRPEMGIAAILALAWETRLSSRLLPLAAAPAFVAGSLYTLLSIGVPVATLRREGWLAIIGPPEAFRNVYAAYAGLDRPAIRLAELGLAAIVLSVIATILVSAAFFSRSARTFRPGAGKACEGAALLLLAAAGVVALRPPDSLAETMSLLPPLVRVVPLLVIALAVRRVLSGRERGGTDPWISDAVLMTAVLFGMRLFLAAGYAGPYNAFLLPLPLLICLAALFWAADKARAAVGEPLPRLVFGSILLFLLARAAAVTDMYRRPEWSLVETPAGGLYLTEPVATATRSTMENLASRLAPGGSLVGFPEGGFFNYVLGFQNPLAQVQFFPGHLDAALEESTVAALGRNPPDAVLLCNVLAASHGARAFGTDYLVRLDRYLHERFTAAASFGPGAGPGARIGDPQFFITILVPRPAASARSSIAP